MSELLGDVNELLSGFRSSIESGAANVISATKKLIYHCLTILFYLVGTAFYIFTVSGVLCWIYVVWAGIISFLTAPIGIKPDSSVDSGLKWISVSAGLGLYILWKIIKHIRINSQESLLGPRADVQPPQLPS